MKDYSQLPDEKVYHVYPQAEEHLHITDTKDDICLCEPEILEEPGGIVIVHNRFIN